MNRLNYIAETNPTWAVTISCFLEEYPEFKPYLYLVPLSPHNPCPYPGIHTFFHAIIHYICASGVRYDYAAKQWNVLTPLIAGNDWELIVYHLSFQNELLQKKKKPIYMDLCNYMNQSNLTHETINLTHLTDIRNNINGIGDGCVAWCKKYFSVDDDCVEYTDITFKKGFQIIYGTTKTSEMKKKSEEWVNKGFGRIGNLMTMQVGGYLYK
jgi:hypothetical protein